METVNWMYLLDPEGMLKLLELALLSAVIACAAQYHKDVSLSNLPDWDSDRAFLFYAVFVIGLAIVFVLFVTVFSLIWAVLCAVASGLFSEVLFKLQEDNWDESKDERIQWRYQHAQAAVILGFLSFLAFLVDTILHYRITTSTQ
ncbi:hypothetical protein OS493_007669 [Desmophyllum pertusum]|uniref:MARVEL domain-containing protein n=1 Tax=Desmophyllum pertusum TaxID=174260 RepID=A0A9W9YRT3_9CNID|nr:hypothetical protein OS493_007669 [Desmophyllum pertusum]